MTVAFLLCESLLLYEGRGKREKGSYEKKIRNEQTNNTHDEDLFSNHALGLFGSNEITSMNLSGLLEL